MAIDILGCNIPYPDFKNGNIINEAEFDANNAELQNSINRTIEKVNEHSDTLETTVAIVSDANSKSNQALANSIEANQKSDVAVLTANEAKSTSLTALSNSEYAVTLTNELDADYAELKPIAEQSILDSAEALSTVNTHRTSNDHDVRYVLKTDVNMDSTLLVNIEVFTIVNANLGNGTFNYVNPLGETVSGSIDVNGNQVFTLIKGSYQIGMNHLDVYVNDTLHRSAASGGLTELSSVTFAISPESSGAEITARYFEIAGGLGIGLNISDDAPLLNNYIGKLWIDTNES